MTLSIKFRVEMFLVLSKRSFWSLWILVLSL